MKENVSIEFNIDYEVKIYADGELVGTSGYKDTFKFSVEKDCLLTFKKGTKKAMIKVFRDKENKIEVNYSTTGQLKASYYQEKEEASEESNKVSENKNVQEYLAKKEKLDHTETLSNVNPNPRPIVAEANTANSNSTNGSGSEIIGGIIALICIGVPIFLWIKGCVATGNLGSSSYIEGGTIAERYALKDIPDDALVLFDTVMEGELTCKADSRTEDAIVLVKCTTTHEDIIKRFGKTVWYGYQSSADGSRYRHKTASTKEAVLKAFQK